MIGIEYAPLVKSSRSLDGIFTIESGSDYDTIFAGSGEKLIKLGYISKRSDWLMEFVPINNIENPYPARSAYTSCLFDVFTLIANDLDLAIEFTIAVNKKVGNNTGLESK